MEKRQVKLTNSLQSSVCWLKSATGNPDKGKWQEREEKGGEIHSVLTERRGVRAGRRTGKGQVVQSE